MTPYLALIRFTAIQTIRDRKLFLVAIFFAGPCALALLLRTVAGNEEDAPGVWRRYHLVLQYMIMGGSVPLMCMLFGPALLLADAEAGTLAYLFTRKLRRASMLLMQYLGMAAVLALIAMIGCAVAHFVTVGGLSEAVVAKDGPKGWRPTDDLWRYLALMPPAVAVFLAVFALISMLTRRSLILAGVYFVGVEVVLANLPISARRYTIAHFLRKTLMAWDPEMAYFTNLPPQSDLVGLLYPPGESGLVGLGLVIIVLLAGSAALATWRQLLPSRTARD